jgi:hypothetical protein
MKKRSSQITIVLMMFVLMLILFFQYPSCCSWQEVEKLSAGEHTIDILSFYEIPMSHFLLCSNNYKPFLSNSTLMTFDMKTGKCRDIYKISLDSVECSSLLPCCDGGWNLYYLNSLYPMPGCKIGMIHINSDGEFEKEKILPITYDSTTTLKAIGSASRGEIWFAGDKIYRLKVDEENWSGFDYPAGWDINQDYTKIFLCENSNKLFVSSLGKTINKIQSLMFDVVNYEFLQIESDKFSCKDIKDWTGHDGCYILLLNDSIWSFNSKTNEISPIYEGFNSVNSKIFEDKSGKYLYLLGKYIDDSNPGNDLITVDLDNKTIEKNILIDENQLVFIDAYSMFDRETNHIITTISNMSSPYFFKPVLIDLNEKTLSKIPVVPEIGVMQISMFYDKSYNRLIYKTYLYPNLLKSYDFEMSTVKTSIPILFQPRESNSLSFVPSYENTKLIANYAGTDLLKSTFPARRELINISIESSRICYYPDSSGSFIRCFNPETQESVFGEFLFNDNLFHEIDISDIGPQYFILDKQNNQIIGYNNEDTNIYFIKPHGDIVNWKTPDEDRATFKKLAYDEYNDEIWMICEGWWEFSEWIFYKISATTKQTIDKFTIPLNSFSFPESLIIDPLNRYLYIIDVVPVDNNYKWVLMIFDIKTREFLKQFTLAENVNSYNSMDVPFTLPIPEKDKLFLWDHFGAWCIDTSNLELLYGDKHDQSQTFFCYDVEGLYNEITNRIVIADLYNKGDTVNRYSPQQVFEIDFDTGEIQNVISLEGYYDEIFLSADKDIIYFLEIESPSIMTVHLNPAWKKPSTIDPSTNFIQLGSGDTAKFCVNVKNPYGAAQNATAYIWLYVPGVDAPFFFDGTGLTTQITGIPLTLPANLDVTGDILTFTMPSGLPEGFYNFNTVLINEHGDRGPIGTWNFYVKD